MEHKYIFNKNLQFIKKYDGNIFIDKSFRNEDLKNRFMFFKVLKWQFSKLFTKKKELKEYNLKVIKSDFLNSNKDMIVWLGHSTFFIIIDGKTVLTDPLFYDLPFIKRLAGLPCKVEELKQIDYILISHGHRDHLDIKSIKKLIELNPNVKFLIPLNMGKILQKYTKNYEEAGWFQKFNSEIDITLLPAYHWHRRGLMDFNKILWGSFLIQNSKTSIYFGGDSAYSKHFKEIKKVANIDIALISIGAYKPKFIMSNSHTSPNEAIKASNDLGAKVFIPMHYGTYKLSDEPLYEPIDLLYSNQNKLKAKLQELNIGEIKEINELF